MPVTRSQIIRWYTVGELEGASHMFIVADLLNHDDFPIYIHLPEDPVETYERLHGKDLQVVAEVYSFYRKFAPQLEEVRALHFD